MAYSNFTLAKVIQDFGLTVDTSRDLFGYVAPVAVDAAVRSSLARNVSLASLLSTEKGKTELLVAPLVVEVWHQTGHTVSVFSGITLDVSPAEGLTGDCDFLLARGPQLPFISPPVLAVVEAKRDDLATGYGPCVSEMVAALRLNARAGTGVETVYGCVTTGVTWKFLRLRGTALAIDIAEYTVHDPDRILGVLLFMVGHNPPAA